MRRIETKQEIEKRRKRTVNVVSIIMLVILVLGTVGYGLGSFYGNTPQEAQSDNLPDGTVTQLGNQWSVRIGGIDYLFANSPDSVKNISIEINQTLTTLPNQPTYLSSQNPAILSELANTLSRYVSLREACYGPCEKDLPEKTCDENVNLIVWQDSLENKVYQEQNCIFIEGDTRAVDAFLFKILSIN